MNIINLTPHVLNIYNADRQPVATLPPEPPAARLEVSSQRVGDVDGIPLYRTVFGEPQWLPEPEEGTIYVVSMLMRNALPEREDLYSPGELLRNEAGQPIGCIGLTR